MPNTVCGTIWQSDRGTTIPSEIRVCDATNLPTTGDLCILGADGEVERSASSGAAVVLFGICMSGAGDKLTTPGYAAAVDAGTPATATFGGAGSRASSRSPSNQRRIARLKKGDRWVMSRADATAVVIGATYGFNRVAAGDYVLDATDANDCLVVEGYYEPDVAAGLAATACRVWVSAFAVPAGD